jgi:plastocyanin
MMFLSNGSSRKLQAVLSTLSLFMLTAGAVIPATALAATHTIVMEGVVFVPETVTVKQGDTVVWVNKDPFPHTATAQDRSFDSGEMGSEKTWRYTVKKKGKFPYLCTLHPTMKGTLVVE